MSVHDLSAALHVSGWTTRRDLADMEQRGLIVRHHGGVTIAPEVALPVVQAADHPRPEDSSRQEAKRRIGQAAVHLILHGQQIVLGAGTTTTEVARALKGRRGLTVVTNALNIARELAGEPGLAVTCTGGDVHGDYHTLTGPVAERALRGYYFDVAVIGVSGITAREGLTVTSQLNAMTMEIMVRHAMRLIVVADQHKWGQVSRAHLAPLEAMDFLVTDAEPSPELREALATANVEVVVAAASTR